jgi:hypothetical protein
MHQARDSGLAGDAEPAAEIIPEGDAQYCADFCQAEEGVATIATDIAAGATSDLTGTKQTKEVQSALASGVSSQAKSSLPICVQKPLPALCRAPLSSTVIQPAVRRPARNASRASVTNSSCPPISSSSPRPSPGQAMPLRNADTDRAQLFHQPWHRDLPLGVLRQQEAAQLRPEVVVTPGGNGAITVRPPGVTQRSRR